MFSNQKGHNLSRQLGPFKLLLSYVRHKYYTTSYCRCQLSVAWMGPVLFVTFVTSPKDFQLYGTTRTCLWDCSIPHCIVMIKIVYIYVKYTHWVTWGSILGINEYINNTKNIYIHILTIHFTIVYSYSVHMWLWSMLLRLSTYIYLACFFCHCG